MESKMATGSHDAISSEELRRRLYQTFKSRGVLDSLKSQLRNQLVHELTHPGLNGLLPVNGHRHQNPSTDESSLLVMAANSIVADHLRKIGYEYSLSVFYPECGLEKEKAFTARDLLQVLKINPRSELYKSIISNLEKNQKGFLIQFLMDLIDYHLSRAHRDAETQTSCASEYTESIVDKFQMIDEEYAAFHPTNLQEDFWETKLLAYRKQIEEQLQEEMRQELQHFKDLELAKVRIQEKELSQKHIEEIRLKLDKMYQKKSETLITREKNAIERLQKQQEIEEKEIYIQRQSLLKDIEAVRNREVELRQRIEAFELTQDLHDQKNKSLEEDLRRRELAVKNIEETYEQKLKNELCRYQLELQEEHRKRMEKVVANEKRVEVEAARLHEESVIIHSKREELQEARVEVKKMEVEMNAATAQVCLLMKQNELLNEKLKDVADYTTLKTENVQLRTEITILRKQLDEVHHENQKLLERLNQPSAAQLALHTELKKVEYSRKLDQDEYQNQTQSLEQQLQNEMERCAKLRSQLIEYEDQTRRMNGQVDDLKLQLRQTQLALENEVYRNPKPPLIDQSIIDLTADRIAPHDVYADVGLLGSRAAPEDRLFYPMSATCANYSKLTEKTCSSPDSDQDFVAGAKARIRELEKESENLEEAYRNYQNRIIRTAIQKSSEAQGFSPVSVNNILSRIPSSHQHRVTFAENAFTSQQLQFTTRGQIHEENRQQITKIEDHQTPNISQFTSPRHCSSTPVKHKLKYDECSRTSEGINTSFPVIIPSVPDHQTSIVNNELHVVNSPNSSRPGTNERSENIPRDHLVICESSTNQRFEESIEQSDDRFKIEQEGNLAHNKNLSQHREEDLNRGSNSSLDQEAILTPADAGKFKNPEEEKGRQDEKGKGEEEKSWEDQRQGNGDKQCLGRQEAKEGEQTELELLELEKEEKRKIEPNEEKSKEQSSEGVELPASNTDPLEKYMKIIQQQKKEELQEQSSKREVEESSLLQTLSDGKADSSAASHDEDDDNFW
ncbi:oral-facial-digital syndrome 1 protein homolog isoform X2 [Chiloscyllium plagiosum]|uniref:oral-facial-digital syndrome 1 protein homolog isoform X2 n=1 Tax=Chiloscyllium plagiosum TaxID=36176 RepID=UPI001CB80741|nr:oral-facial-digital syndrome 1 protein homolog isoform X2 [Chiloscyllium plagiosum]